MDIRMPLARLATVAIAATLAAEVFVDEAMAAKETFERNKPHVNIGTIGQGDKRSNPSGITTQGAASGGPANVETGHCAETPPPPSGQAGC